MDISWLQGAGTLVGGLGQVYGAYNQNKQYDKMNKLYEQDRNRAIKKEDMAQLNLDTAINDVYGLDSKKKKENGLSFDLGMGS